MIDGTAIDIAAELKPIRIFVCSSGDMIAERQAALRVIEAVNRAARGAVRLEPYLWEEHTYGFQGAQSYQGNIPLPAEFDIFLGFLFSRIGSRLTEQEYRRDILAKAANLTVSTAPDGTDAQDPLALTQLTADLPAEALPTGTTFEIINAREAAQRPEGGRRPCLWLAVNSAIPDGMNSRDLAIAEPVRQRWYEVSQFVEEELNARHVPVADYGVDMLRAQQLKPGGLQEFEDNLEAWLTNTLATRFAVRLSWAERAYIGLRPFTPEEAPIFLGRRASIGEALGQLDQLARLGKATMLLLTGPSGAGKSSFARAGLIGHLGAYRLHRRRAEGSLFVEDLVRTWLHLAVRPAELGDGPAGGILTRLGALLAGTDAFARLASELAALPFADATDTVPPALAERLRALVQRRLAEAGRAPALFLLLDQLEDLLATDRTAATRRLLALFLVLAECAERNVWVVVAIADQWRSTLGSAGLVTALEGADRFALPPPRLGELREIIEMPARRAGLIFEQGPHGALDQVIVDDLQALSLHAEAPLPLLQVALARLEDRKEGNLLTFAAYRAMGGVTGAIREHARAALVEWQTAERRPVLERLLFRLVQRDPQQRIVCRLAPRAELESDPEMRALEEHLVAPEWRLLQGHDERDAVGAIRIAHDVLLDHADAFRLFVETERDNVILLADAQDDAARWLSEGRPPALLNHHLPTVERLQSLLARLQIQADDEVAAFVAASRQEIGRLQEERNAALLTRSRFLAEFARQRNEASDFGTALAIGLEAIPNAAEAVSRAVASEAVVELDRAARLLLERSVFRGHEDWVVRAVFDRAGARVLTTPACDDPTVRLWNVTTDAEIAVLRHEHDVRSAVFSGDGTRVLTASGDKTARVWDAATCDQLVAFRGHEDNVECAVFDASDERVLTASWDTTARLWDATTGAELSVLRGHKDKVEIAVFDPSGRRVLTASDDKTARLWDAANSVELAVLRGHEGKIGSAVFDPSGTRVLTASTDATARLWDAVTGVELFILRGHEDEVGSAMFDPSGTRVLTASSDRTARLWDAATGAELTTLRGHEGKIGSAVFDPSGTYVLTASWDRTARLWDTGTGTQLATLRGHEGGVSDAVFDPAGVYIVTASADRTARLWMADVGPELAALSGHQGPVWNAVFDPSGARALTASSDRTARLWDTANGGELAILRGHEGQVMGAVFDPSGKRVLTASWDQTARIWDATSGTELAVLRGHRDGVSRAAFDLYGAQALTASHDKTARLWDAATGAERAILFGHEGELTSVGFDRLGARVLTASSDGTARLWDAATGAGLVVLHGHEQRVQSARFDPSGTRVLTASSDGTARVWDAASGAKLVILRGHEMSVESAVFDPSGVRVLTASNDRTARLWDAENGAELAVLRGHESAVLGAAFDLSGARVLTASEDKTVRLWDVESGAELAVLRGHEDDVTSAVFDASGARILTASRDGTARIWRVFPTVAELVVNGGNKLCQIAA